MDPTVATIRKRPKVDTPLSDSMCTPAPIAERLPYVDFDPCSNERSLIRSRWSFGLHKGLDGLKLPWRGRGFMNFPFSLPLPWCEKLHDEFRLDRCIEMITLCKLDPTTKWWHTLTQPHPITEAPPEIWLFKQRIEYDEPPELTERRMVTRETLKPLQLEARERLKAAKKAKEPDDIIARLTADLKAIKVPPAETSNNFCSVIVHHRGFDGKRLMQFDGVATLWIQP